MINKTSFTYVLIISNFYLLIISNCWLICFLHPHHFSRVKDVVESSVRWFCSCSQESPSGSEAWQNDKTCSFGCEDTKLVNGWSWSSNFNLLWLFVVGCLLLPRKLCLQSHTDMRRKCKRLLFVVGSLFFVVCCLPNLIFCLDSVQDCWQYLRELYTFNIPCSFYGK